MFRHALKRVVRQAPQPKRLDGLRSLTHGLVKKHPPRSSNASSLFRHRAGRACAPALATERTARLFSGLNDVNDETAPVNDSSPNPKSLSSFEDLYEGASGYKHVNRATLPLYLRAQEDSTHSLDEITITWEQWGDPSLGAERTVVIFPSFSHGSHARSSPSDERPGWWEFVIGPGAHIDTDKWRVICPSFVGSPYSDTTSPKTINPNTGSLSYPYGPNFPRVTPADMARGHKALMDELGLGKVHAVIGGSLGGMQAVAFITLFPDRASRAVIISSTARTSPFSSALRLQQRHAIENDPEFREGLYNIQEKWAEGPVEGLRAARMMGMVWYRSREEFDRRFEWGYDNQEGDLPNSKVLPGTSEVQSYLSYQASKFSKQFDANCYLLLSRSMDLFDVGRSVKFYCKGFKEEGPEHESKMDRLKRALNRVKCKVKIIGVAQDALIPISEQEELYNVLKTNDKDVTFVNINDQHGHDAMFNERVCKEKFAPVIKSFIDAENADLTSHGLALKRVRSKRINPTELGGFTRTIMGADAARILGELPFHLPYESWLTRVGDTPVVELEPGLFAKMEGSNPGGSIKDRALTALFLNKFATGELTTKGSTLALVTSGWAGLSLARLHKAISEENQGSESGRFHVNLVMVVPLAYKDRDVPAQLVKEEGVTTYYGGFDEFNAAKGRDEIREGSISLILQDASFLDALNTTYSQVKKHHWVLVDQHHDIKCMNAHASTALELMCQVPGLTDVVCATGTGATAAGLRNYLPWSIAVHSRPASSGTVDGLTDVNRYDNFCDSETLEGYNCGEVLGVDDALEHRRLLLRHDILAGPSSGSCYWLPKRIQAKKPAAKLVFICADGVSQRSLCSPDDHADSSPLNTGAGSDISGSGQQKMQMRSYGSWAGRNAAVPVPQSSATRKFMEYATQSRALGSESESSESAKQYDHTIIGGGPVEDSGSDNSDGSGRTERAW